MPTMSRGTSFKAGFLQGDGSRRRRCRECGRGPRHDGPRSGSGSRSRPGGWRPGLPKRQLRVRAEPRNDGGPVTDGGSPGPGRSTASRPAPVHVPARRGWCERGDSNPHGLPHWHLKPARLPIPPLSRPPVNAQYAALEPCLGIAVRVSRSCRGGHRFPRRRTVDATVPPSGAATSVPPSIRRLPGASGRDTGVWLKPRLPRRPPRSGPTPGTPRSSVRPLSLPGPRGSSAGSGAY